MGDSGNWLTGRAALSLLAACLFTGVAQSAEREQPLAAGVVQSILCERVQGFALRVEGETRPADVWIAEARIRRGKDTLRFRDLTPGTRVEVYGRRKCPASPIFASQIRVHPAD